MNLDQSSLSNVFISFVKRYKFLFLLLLFIFFLRIPSLMEPNRYADEDIYLTLGHGMRQGLVFYRDIHDNKPPLLYVVAGLAGNLFWFRFILLVVHAIGVVIFYKLAELVFDNRRWAILISTLIFGLFSTLPPLEGNIANGENFMIVSALAGVYLLYRALINLNEHDRIWVYPLAGFLFSIAFLFKIPIAFDFAGIVLFWLFFVEPELRLTQRLARLFSKEFILLIGGFLMPILLSIVYYAFNGAFEPYVRSALMQNIGYLSSWGGEGGSVLQNPLVWRGLVVIGLTGLLLIFSKRISLASRFVLVWTVFSMYGALLSSRPYPHYLLEPLVPVSLLLMLVIIQFLERRAISLSISILVLVLIIVSYYQIDFWEYETLSYYRNYVDYASGKKSWDDYLKYWGAGRNYQVASYLQHHTSENDRVYVWGTEPAIYSVSGRLPVSRYTVAYHVVDFDAYDHTIQAIQSEKPMYIVVFEDGPDFEALHALLEKGYLLETTIDGVSVYRILY